MQQFVSDIAHFVEGSPVSHDKQVVSDIAHFVKGSLTISFPLTNREWVILHILWNALSSHLFLWPTACVWHSIFCERQSHHILSYNQQRVSDIAHFVKGSFIFLWPTGSEWLHILWKAVSSHFHLSYDQQQVSDILHFVKDNLIISFPMTNRKWVTLHILWKALLSLDPQGVSDIQAHFVKGSLISSFPMTKRKWVTLYICERQAHFIFSYDQQEVSNIGHFERQSHHIFSYDQQLVSDICSTFYERQPQGLHLFLWLTVCEWHCTFCERHFKLSHLFFWPAGSEWHWILFCERQSHHIFPITNRKWVTLHILWKTITSLLFLSPIGSEWHFTFCERQESHHIFPYGQQLVSDIAKFLICILSITQFMNAWYIQNTISESEHSMLSYLFHLFLLHYHYHRL